MTTDEVSLPSGDEHQTISGPSSGGLRGKWASMGNLTAVGFVMIMFYIVYSNGVDSQEKHNAAIREEMKESRKSHSKDAEEVAVEIRGMRNEFRSLSLTNQSLVAELRASRLQMDKMIKAGLKMSKDDIDNHQ